MCDRHCDTPQMAQREPTSLPPAVAGAMSPYPERGLKATNHITET